MRLIDADALRDELKESYDKLWLIYQEQTTLMDREICKAELVTFNEVLLRLKDAPTIEAELVRHGEWEKKTIWFGHFGENQMVCSVCNKLYGFNANYHFCPNCGATMDGGAEDG